MIHILRPIPVCIVFLTAYLLGDHGARIIMSNLDYASTAQFPIHNRYANYADQYSNRSSFDFRRWLEAQDWLSLVCQIFLYFSYGLHDNSVRYPLYEIRYMKYTHTSVGNIGRTLSGYKRGDSHHGDGESRVQPY